MVHRLQKRWSIKINKMIGGVKFQTFYLYLFSFNENFMEFR